MLTTSERITLLAEEPGAAPFIRPILGSEEFINGIDRWCLWLKDVAPGVLRLMPKVMERIERVRQHRLASNRLTTTRLATTPTRFGEDRQPNESYLLVPGVSSEGRSYIPMALQRAEVISNNLVFVSPGATAWHFGVLTSSMHMAWMRQLAGRLKSDYRYSAGLVYNNFPWPDSATPAQRAAVENAARAVLAAREPHLPPRGMRTLADLYDPLSMPAELAKGACDAGSRGREGLRRGRPGAFPAPRQQRPRAGRTPLSPLRKTHRPAPPRHPAPTLPPLALTDPAASSAFARRPRHPAQGKPRDFGSGFLCSWKSNREARRQGQDADGELKCLARRRARSPSEPAGGPGRRTAGGLPLGSGARRRMAGGSTPGSGERRCTDGDRPRETKNGGQRLAVFRREAEHGARRPEARV